MRLGIITGNVAGWSRTGGLLLHPPLGRIYDELLRRFPDARIALPIAPVAPAVNTYEMAFAPERVTALPPLVNTIKAQRHLVETRRTLRGFAARCDALFVRMPFQVPLVLHALGKPKVLHVVANSRAVLEVSTDYRGLWGVLARAYARHSAWSLEHLVCERDTAVVCNGGEMYEKLGCPPGRVVVSASLRAAEIDPRPRPLSDPPRLLFLAFLRPEKGIHILLDAFERLRARRPLRLSLAGGQERVGDTEKAVLARVAASPYARDIELTGLLDFGPKLFELYRTHDLHVLPSLSEGTPRTLVEARAFGCPVVATRVGGIPTSVEHGVDGLLVPPGDAGALAEAIAKVLDDDALRARLVAAGAERARQFTLERFMDEVEAELRAVHARASWRAT